MHSLFICWWPSAHTPGVLFGVFRVTALRASRSWQRDNTACDETLCFYDQILCLLHSHPSALQLCVCVCVCVFHVISNSNLSSTPRKTLLFTFTVTLLFIFLSSSSSSSSPSCCVRCVCSADKQMDGALLALQVIMCISVCVRARIGVRSHLNILRASVYRGCRPVVCGARVRRL